MTYGAESMDIAIDYFPQGLASGDSFCNRIQEQKKLEENIKLTRPTLVMSPRRYGKTSLILKVLNNVKTPYAHMDLYSELNEMEIQNTVLSAIGDILFTLESGPKKALQFVTEFFSDLSVNFKFVGAQIKIEFSRSRKSPAKVILEALQKLDVTLKKKNKKAVLFFDEFQRLGQITDNATIEGALRQVAQSSKHIQFIFSGSNRHLLAQMFDDRTKPLYKLCDRLILERMNTESYLPFINEKAVNKWKKPLDTEVIDTIISLTEQHPYYVNILCHRLWLNSKMPTTDTVETIWRQYCIEEKSNVMNELDLLSHNQSKMLIAIAKYGDSALPMSAEFIGLTAFPLSSASQSLKILMQKDYLFMNENQRYCILDPMIKFLFSEEI